MNLSCLLSLRFGWASLFLRLCGSRLRRLSIADPRPILGLGWGDWDDFDGLRKAGMPEE
jgi:hypothetical protein